MMPERTYLNESWESDLISGRRQMRGLQARAEKLYTEKVHQKCQKSFAPYKESCVVIKEDCTLDQAKDFAKRVEEGIPGIECVGIWIHRDEGHYKSIYIEGDESFVCNTHAHFLWRCQNLDTGKAIPLKRQDLRNMQDWAADAFGMERGTAAEYTKRNHIPSMDYKLKAMGERLDTLQAAVDQISTTKEAKKATVESIKAAKEGFLSLMGKSAHQKEVEGLKSQIKAIHEEYAQKLKGKDKEIDKIRAESNGKDNKLKNRNWEIDKYKREINTLKEEFSAVIRNLNPSASTIKTLKAVAPVLMKAVKFINQASDEATM
ncbi:MAG: hypothetical protein GY915_00080 [bacterium]|nr:hypothetical protein [bacterium]